jgi:hypothetical protein
MDRKFHYHIRWAQIPLLDYESFNSRVEADAAAKVLARRGETYTHRWHDSPCSSRWDAAKAKSADATAKVYREPE